jgi:Leucine-rich repeat (LRR) protein
MEGEETNEKNEGEAEDQKRHGMFLGFRKNSKGTLLPDPVATSTTASNRSSRGLGRGKSRRTQPEFEVMAIPTTQYTDPPTTTPNGSNATAAAAAAAAAAARRSLLLPSSFVLDGSNQNLTQKREPSFRKLVAASQAGAFSSRPMQQTTLASGWGVPSSKNNGLLATAMQLPPSEPTIPVGAFPSTDNLPRKNHESAAYTTNAVGAIPSTGNLPSKQKGIRRTVATPSKLVPDADPGNQVVVGAIPTSNGNMPQKKAKTGPRRTVTSPARTTAEDSTTNDGAPKEPSFGQIATVATVGAIPSTDSLPWKKEGEAPTTSSIPNAGIFPRKINEVMTPPPDVRRAVSQQVGAIPSTQQPTTGKGAIRADPNASHPSLRKAGLRDHSDSESRAPMSDHCIVGAISTSGNVSQHPAQRKAGLQDPGPSTSNSHHYVGAIPSQSAPPQKGLKQSAGLRDRSDPGVSHRRASTTSTTSQHPVGAVSSHLSPAQKGLKQSPVHHKGLRDRSDPGVSHRRASTRTSSTSTSHHPVGAVASYSAPAQKGLRQSHANQHQEVEAVASHSTPAQKGPRQSSTHHQDIGAVSSHTAPAQKGLRQSNHRPGHVSKVAEAEHQSHLQRRSTEDPKGKQDSTSDFSGRTSFRSVRDESLSEISAGAGHYCTFQDITIEGVEGSLSLDPMWLTFSPNNLSGENILRSRSWRWDWISKRLVKERMNVMKIIFSQEHNVNQDHKPQQSILLHLTSLEELQRLMKETSRRIRHVSSGSGEFIPKRDTKRPDGLLSSALGGVSAETVWEDEETGNRTPAEQYAKQPGDDQLVQAYAVDEEELPILPSAEQFDEERKAREAKERKTKSRSRVMVCVCVGLLIIAVAVGIFVAAQGNKEILIVVNNTEAPSASPSAAPTIEGDRILDGMPDFTVDAVFERYSPQRKAFVWLKNDPAWKEYSPARLRQRFVLATLYHALSGDKWWDHYMVGSNWLSSEHECDWAISDNSTVMIVDREGFYYYTKPSNPCSEGNMSSEGEGGERLYTHLWLPSLGLKGKLPLEIYLLSNLEYLFLRDNRLGGKISSHIGMLTALKAVNLAYTDLTGEIPLELMNCTNLEALILTKKEGEENTFSGGIPSEIGNLKSLKHFHIHDCGLNSTTIPTEMGQLSRLETFWAKRNHFHGPIPSELGLLRNLKDLDLSLNSLTGPAPSEIGFLGNLMALEFAYNLATGTLPTQFGLLSNLRYLSVAGNQLTGPIPSEISNLASIEAMSLRLNDLNGSLPTELGKWRFPANFSLSQYEWGEESFLMLSGNQLTGPIPSEIGLWGDLGRLELQWNYFSGFIPTEIGLLSGLGTLYIHFNYLDGNIPSEMGQLYSTFLLFMDWNNFTSTLPPELGNMASLEEFSVAHNQLTGSISSTISQIPRLAYFSVAENQLTGQVPVFDSVVSGWFFNNSYVPDPAINITGNDFTGTIPYQLCALNSNEFEFDCGENLCGCWCLCLQLSGGNKKEEDQVVEEGSDYWTVPLEEQGDDYWKTPAEDENGPLEDGNDYWATTPVEEGATAVEGNDYWIVTPPP